MQEETAYGADMDGIVELADQAFVEMEMEARLHNQRVQSVSVGIVLLVLAFTIGHRLGRRRA